MSILRSTTVTDLQAVNAVVAIATVGASVTNVTAPARDHHAVALNKGDPLEAERFAALAVTWWERQRPFWLLHCLNAPRVEYLRDTLTLTFGPSRRSPTQQPPRRGFLRPRRHSIARKGSSTDVERRERTIRFTYDNPKLD